MKQKSKRLVLISALMVALVTGSLIAYLQHQPSRSITELEISVAQIPVGATAKEADAIIGSDPDSVEEQEAILVNPVMMFAGSSVQGRKYGEPKTYVMRTWIRDGVRATVAIDHSGKVAARWTAR